MRSALLVLAAAAAWAQSPEDARSLAASVVNAARSAGSIRAEGTLIEETAGTAPSRKEILFEVVTQGPLLLRYRAMSDAAGPTLRICDGTSRWDYSEARNTYTRTTEDGEICMPPVARWADLLDGLIEARIGMAERYCTAIEASYTNFRRMLCIDRARRQVLRERFEYFGPPQRTVSIEYARVEYNAAQPAELFQFRLPAGSTQDGAGGMGLGYGGASGGRVPYIGEGGAGHYAGPGPGSTAPVLIFRHDPDYTPEARRAKLTGAVVLGLTVDEKGVPQNMKVIRGLGMGLDEKAIEAVSEWRFKPGTRGGRPVSTNATVEVSFRNP